MAGISRRGRLPLGMAVEELFKQALGLADPWTVVA